MLRNCLIGSLFSGTGLVLTLVVLAAQHTGVVGADQRDVVERPGQSLVDESSCTYTLQVSGYICSEDRNYTYDGQFCCQDRSTKACVLSSMGKACPIASNTFCIWCPGEIIPANRTAVETVRVLDTTGKYYVQDDCVLRGTGPFNGCGDNFKNKAETLCCKDDTARNCIAWGDAYCPMHYPASFCSVCRHEKVSDMEIANLVLGIFGALGTLAGMFKSKTTKRLMAKLLGKCAPHHRKDHGPEAFERSGSDKSLVICLSQAPESDEQSQSVIVKFRAASSSSSSSLGSRSSSSGNSSPVGGSPYKLREMEQPAP